jgi:Uncharacterised protein family (UPF0182)
MADAGCRRHSHRGKRRARAVSASGRYCSLIPGSDVKLSSIIHAYNGKVDFYLADPSDPIAATYQRIFPELFKPLAAMPQVYPEDLFLIQAQVFRAYHIDSP